MKKIMFMVILILCVVSIGACTSITKGCTKEAKVCPDGSTVGRTGLNCEFAPCPETNNSIISCSMEAKVCPDGSAVGRTGPNCEFALCPGTNSSISLSSQYESLKTNFTLKYISFEKAVQNFKQLDTSGKIEVETISFYVAGKVPREDGDPYFIGKGIINSGQNKCVYGYYNLVSGEGKVHEDVCEIIG